MNLYRTRISGPSGGWVPSGKRPAWAYSLIVPVASTFTSADAADGVAGPALQGLLAVAELADQAQCSGPCHQGQGELGARDQTGKSSLRTAERAAEVWAWGWGTVLS